VRTVTSREFEDLKNELLKDAKPVEAPLHYEGVVYQRPDGVRFGFRTSGSGETIDIIDSASSGLSNDFKVHQK